MTLTLQLEMAKRNSVGSVQRNMQSSKNFQPAYGTAQDDDVSPRCCCPSVLLTVYRTAASAVRWSPSSPTCWSSSRCPSPSGAASRWCRSTREQSSSDSVASSRAGPRVRACSSSCHASTPTGRYLVSSHWHGLHFNFRYLCSNRYCWNIDGYKCKYTSLQVCWPENRGIRRAAAGDPHQGQRHHQRGRRRLLPGQYCQRAFAKFRNAGNVKLLEDSILPAAVKSYNDCTV